MSYGRPARSVIHKASVMTNKSVSWIQHCLIKRTQKGVHFLLFYILFYIFAWDIAKLPKNILNPLITSRTFYWVNFLVYLMAQVAGCDYFRGCLISVIACELLYIELYLIWLFYYNRHQSLVDNVYVKEWTIGSQRDGCWSYY